MQRTFEVTPGSESGRTLPCLGWGMLLTLILMDVMWAAGFPRPTIADIDPAGIDGALVICGGGKVPAAAVDRFVELAGGKAGRLVVIPTASGRADESDVASLTNMWSERGFATVVLLHTRDREAADTDDFCAPLRSATAVWFVGGQQSRLSEAYVGTRVEQELAGLLRRGGVIGGTSAGAAIQSRLMIARGNPEATLMQGFDLLPGTVIDQHFKVRNRQPRLTGVLKDHPGYVGCGIDEDTALIVEGRTMRVVGESLVTVCLAESENRPAKQSEIRAGKTTDLTALRRAAIARSRPAFPKREPQVPSVTDGSLLIVGGGRVTDEMWTRFVELAGRGDARIVVVPTASEKPRMDDRSEVRAFQQSGANSVTVLHTSDRSVADTDEFVQPLRGATGVWFGGGRQWRLVDVYAGTATEQAFHDVLLRGGIIGGSSAGATIQGDYLVRGNPLGNREMMAEGYERGFGFLPGVAIDQHFTQRSRQVDMEALKATFPQLLGIGIDESTAILVQGTQAVVVGENAVSFYNAPQGSDTDRASFESLSAGGIYDFQLRRPLE